MNKKVRVAARAMSFAAALGLAVGCGKGGSEKAKERVEKMIEDAGKPMTEEPASEPYGSHGSDFSDPMYDIGAEGYEILDATGPSAETKLREEITQDDLERAIAVLEGQLK